MSAPTAEEIAKAKVGVDVILKIYGDDIADFMGREKLKGLQLASDVLRRILRGEGKR